MNYGHWEFPYKFNIDEWYGFVYRIVDLNTNQEYIGKKTFWNTTRKKVKGKKNRKIIRKESDWKEYTGSSTRLNEQILEKGKENFKFQIESLHKTKASLSYNEIRKQILEDVLRTRLDDGTPKYYNRQIGSVKYIPPTETEDESKMKTDIFIVERNLNKK